MLARHALTGVVPSTLAAMLTVASGSYAQDAPKILLDQPLRAVEYQLGRLSNEELVLVERKEGDVRYRPVYFALLTRKGVAPQFRDEALTAIVGLDKTSKSRVLLEALAKVPIDDALTGEKLLGLLLAQSTDTLRKERATFVQAIDTASSPPLVLRGAYGAILIGDGKPDEAWQAAVKHQGHLVELLLSVRYLPAAPASGGGTAVRDQLFDANRQAPCNKRGTRHSDGGPRRARLDSTRRNHLRSPGEGSKTGRRACVSRRSDRLASAHPRDCLARCVNRAAGARHRRHRGGHTGGPTN